MQFDFIFKPAPPAPAENFLFVRGRRIPLVIIRSSRARRYLLALRPDGSARLTIPRRGAVREGRQFAERNSTWLASQIEKLAAHPPIPTQWLLGAEIMFRGEMIKLEAAHAGAIHQIPHAPCALKLPHSSPSPPQTCGGEGRGEEAPSRLIANAIIRCGSELIPVPHLDATADLRPPITRHLWRLAAREFPPLVFAFAARHQLTVQRVTVRNQKSRWGSCSRRGTISLNWRLIQTPPFVRDYIILHELMHLRQMNHSARYWREVESVCPDYQTAERWLKQNSALLK